MLKFLYLFALLFAVCNSATYREAHIKSVNVIKGKNNHLVTITKKEDKTEMKWNEPVSKDLNALRANFFIRYPKTGKKDAVDFDNLCGTFEKYSLERNVQKFILGTIAGLENCPIKKSSMSSIAAPTTFKYSISNNNNCGQFYSEIKLFQLKDKSNAHPMLTITFKGNITC